MGEACKDVAVSETIRPNSISAKPGPCLVRQAHDLNYFDRPLRTRMPGGVGVECVTMMHLLSRMEGIRWKSVKRLRPIVPFRWQL